MPLGELDHPGDVQVVEDLGDAEGGATSADSREARRVRTLEPESGLELYCEDLAQVRGVVEGRAFVYMTTLGWAERQSLYNLISREWQLQA